jgi:hypothetical protein
LLHITSDPAEAARAPIGEAFVADIGPTASDRGAKRKDGAARAHVTCKDRVCSCE